jgi:asparagine synthase (glutamine-hydrolysing)
LDPRLIIGLGTLEDKWLFTGRKGKYIQKTAMQSRLPNEIINFRKIGLSAPWGDYITKSPAFKDELFSFSKSELFKMPYFENIQINNLIKNLQKGDTKMTPYLMPLFMMHIWMKNYVEKFNAISTIA